MAILLRAAAFSVLGAFWVPTFRVLANKGYFSLARCAREHAESMTRDPSSRGEQSAFRVPARSGFWPGSATAGEAPRPGTALKSTLSLMPACAQRSIFFACGALVGTFRDLAPPCVSDQLLAFYGILLPRRLLAI